MVPMYSYCFPSLFIDSTVCLYDESITVIRVLGVIYRYTRVLVVLCSWERQIDEVMVCKIYVIRFCILHSLKSHTFVMMGFHTDIVPVLSQFTVTMIHLVFPRSRNWLDAVILLGVSSHRKETTRRNVVTNKRLRQN